MLKNYFKIAIAVLKRRKFFTFISLFGISFSLTILIVITAFIDNSIRAGYPETRRDRCLYLNYVELQNLKEHNHWSSAGTFYFLNHYTGLLKTPAKVSISSEPAVTNTYVNNKKLVIALKFTNKAFWEVLEFNFLEGKPYSQEQIDNAEHVAVISAETRKSYFGDATTVVGKYVEADNVKYRVIGVIKNVPITNFYSFGDIFLPYTVSKGNYKDQSLIGNYSAIILPDNRADISKVKKEFQEIVSRIPLPKGFDLLTANADSYLDGFTRQLFGGPQKNTSGFTSFVLILILFALLFLLLPTLNLVNINTSRIMERSSEIGVRKAFGASSSSLVCQFIVENVILTLLGGIIALLLSVIILQVINSSHLLQNTSLSVNFTVILYAVITCLVFGFFSGVYPAWRMSKLHVVDALKS